MNHCMANLDTGGKSIHNQASCLPFQNADEVGISVEVGVASVHGGGELPLQFCGQYDEFLPIGIADDQRTGTEDFVS